MATEEQKLLSQYLKDVHANLRKLTLEYGVEKAWTEHCKNKEVLGTYANYMKKLANTYWESNCANKNDSRACRIQWTINLCYEYFINKNYIVHKNKENKIATTFNMETNNEESFSEVPKVIDVGSCYNPFKKCIFLDVLAIDLYPANDTVMNCDFLAVPIGSETLIKNKRVEQLQSSSFEIVTFCFLLEYIPTSELRIKACEKAYELLKPGGLLIINTPDSKHVGANSKIMKCWQYTLACMGYIRIKYEKFKHMHSMAYRKAICSKVAIRWAHLHKMPYMEYAINIPQDFNIHKENQLSSSKFVLSANDFKELPFCSFEDNQGL